MLTPQLRKQVLASQRNEITEYAVYLNLAKFVNKKEHAELLKKIALEEKAHYEYFKTVTLVDVAPDNFRIFKYVTLSRLLGLNFGLKLMERGEHMAQDTYAQMEKVAPKISEIMRDENKHEMALLDLIDEDRLKYMSSVILGLNDALVELTAMLAGFTLALQNTKLIGVLGLITGVAAAMSMAASEYLSTKHEETDKDPLKASIYTGTAYILAVIFLVTPYFFLGNIFLCLALAIGMALLCILGFTFYVSVAQGFKFWERFFEMAWLSLTVATITFFIGLGARHFFGISV